MDLTGKSLKITSKRNGFRRGGIAHPAKPTIHNASDFTDEQLGQIMAESGKNLVVEVLDGEVKKDLPEDEKAQRFEQIVKACKKLIADGEKTNCPDVSKLCGFEVSAKDRDAALAIIEAEKKE